MKRMIINHKISKVSQIELNTEQSKRFNELGLDWYGARKQVEAMLGPNTDLTSHRSEHYELAVALTLKGKPVRVLEIGTAEGDFTGFLATVFPDAIIETIELPSTDNRFWSATIGQTTKSRKNFNEKDLKERDAKLAKFQNIVFREENSLALTFQMKGEYDLIWVDGDHTYPVVSIDIANALRLLKVGGTLGFDDIYLSRQTDYKWVGNESFDTLTQFKNAGLINFDLILKKLFREKNYDRQAQKFIAVATRAR